MFNGHDRLATFRNKEMLHSIVTCQLKDSFYKVINIRSNQSLQQDGTGKWQLRRSPAVLCLQVIQELHHDQVVQVIQVHLARLDHLYVLGLPEHSALSTR